MKRKFVRVMFFGALTLSTVTYVGCKDYDDDISNLQTQIDANKASIADLKKFVDEGKWVKDVASITGGFKITFSDGKTFDVVNGVNGVNGVKGDKGDTGAAGTPGAPGTPGAAGTPGSKVTIDPVTGEWLIDKEPTGWFANVKDGADGQSPFIGNGTNGDKGYWYFWDVTAKAFVKGDKAQGENGESITGTNGKSPFINDDGLWVYYNAAGEEVTGPKAIGTDGKDAQSPFIGEDGYWYYWDATVENADGTTGKLVAGAYAQTSVYIVEAGDRPAWELHVGMMGEDGKITDTTIILPKADKLSSMAAVSIAADGVISEGMTSPVTMYYGILAKGTTVVFNGVTYGSTEKATTLVGANLSEPFHALINPVSVDFSEYPVELVNSHGVAYYTVTSKEKNLSEKPLLNARAADKQWNQGVYDLKISLIGDMASADLDGEKMAYALRAKDAWGNDLISRYDVKIIAENVAKDIDNKSQDVDYTLSANLDKLFAGELAKVAAHYYTIAPAALTAIGSTFDEASSTISAPTKQGSIDVKVNYLKTDGTKVEGTNAKTFTVNFTYNTGDDITIADAVVWNLTKGASATDMTKNKSELTIKSTDPLFTLLNKEFTNKVKPTVRLKSVAFASGDKITVDGKEYAMVANSIALAAGQPVAVKDADGNVTGYKITFNFDPTKVAAVKHNAVLEVLNPDYASGSGLNDEVLKKVKVTVDVKNPGIFAFEPLNSYFIANTSNAIAYGTPANGIIKENIYNFFDAITAADKTHISFTEVIPNFGTADAPVLGQAWLQNRTNSEMQVPQLKAQKNDGAYSTRGLTIAYQPFGNIRLAAISKAFNLTVKSAILEGTKVYEGAKGTGILSLAIPSFDIKTSEIKVKDVYAKDVTVASTGRDTRVTNVTIELDTEIAKYAEIKDAISSPVAFGSSVTVQLKASTVSIQTELKGFALVKITDTWGAETVVKCPITLSPAK